MQAFARLVLLTLSALTLGSVATPRAEARSQSAVVQRVIEGDRLEVRSQGRTPVIQLIGLDTPRAGRECGGTAARKVMKHLAAGERVRLSHDPALPDADSHGRLLRYVALAGRDLGKVQVYRGWSEVSSDRFARAAKYRDAAEAAYERRAGVWNFCDGNFHQPL